LSLLAALASSLFTACTTQAGRPFSTAKSRAGQRPAQSLHHTGRSPPSLQKGCTGRLALHSLRQTGGPSALQRQALSRRPFRWPFKVLQSQHTRGRSLPTTRADVQENALVKES
jgi:hypothetical protein